MVWPTLGSRTAKEQNRTYLSVIALLVSCCSVILHIIGTMQSVYTENSHKTSHSTEIV